MSNVTFYLRKDSHSKLKQRCEERNETEGAAVSRIVYEKLKQEGWFDEGKTKK